MSRRIGDVAVALTCLFVLSGPAAAADLSIGDPAPSLVVSRWLKGESVKRLESGQIYVVEFSATYCGPCLALAPHLSTLQERYPHVTIISVMVCEPEPAKVAPLVAKMGNRIRYRVALDDVPVGKSPDEGVMHRTWMIAAGESMLSTAFIINKDGKVAWVGLGTELDGPLGKIIAGDWNLANAAKERRERRARETKFHAVQKESADLVHQKKDWDGAFAVIDRAIAESPSPDEMLIDSRRYMVDTMNDARFKKDVESALQRGDLAAARAAVDRELARTPDDKKGKDYPWVQMRDNAWTKIWFFERIGDKQAACDELETLIKKYQTNAEALYAIAEDFVDPEEPPIDLGERGRRLTLQAASLVNEITKGEDPDVLDLLAQAYFLNDQAALALKCEEKAVALAVIENPDFQKRLRQYRKAVESSAKK
jgi:thiol-disulfide isomerase/thioredoxin/tetratricopeptide (TPR) repeat protein